MTAALAVLAFFNPLCGFWTITARPDMGAAMLELLGVALFLRYLRDGTLRWIVFAALALFGAWSFKQTSVDALAGIAATLVGLRRGGALALLGAVWLGCVAAALVLLGPDYRQQLCSGQLHAGFSAAWALHHLDFALLKMPLIAVAAGNLAGIWTRDRTTPASRTVGLILIFALVFDLMASSKGGAGDYYFIPLGVWSALWVGLRMGTSKEDESFAPSSVARRSTATGRTLCAYFGGGVECRELILPLGVVVASMLILLDVAVIFVGRAGVIDCRDPRQPYEHLAVYLAARPGPVFVEDTYGDLPWISPTAPHFVVAYNDEPDRRAGVAFERGGWRRLLAEGYFTTVVTQTGSPYLSAALPPRYRFVRQEAGWRYFERKQDVIQ